jgi:hypothetical protein
MKLQRPHRSKRLNDYCRRPGLAAWFPMLRIRGRIRLQESLQRRGKNLTGWTQRILACAAAPLAPTVHRPLLPCNLTRYGSHGIGRYARRLRKAGGRVRRPRSTICIECLAAHSACVHSGNSICGPWWLNRRTVCVAQANVFRHDDLRGLRHTVRSAGPSRGHRPKCLPMRFGRPLSPFVSICTARREPTLHRRADFVLSRIGPALLRVMKR